MFFRGFYRIVILRCKKFLLFLGVGKIQPKENSLGIVSRTYGNRVSRIHNSNNALQGKN